MTGEKKSSPRRGSGSSTRFKERGMISSVTSHSGRLVSRIPVSRTAPSLRSLSWRPSLALPVPSNPGSSPGPNNGSIPNAVIVSGDSLRFTSAASVLLAVVFVFISTGMALSALFQGKTKTPRLLPDFAKLSSPFELFTAVPVIVVAFTFHFNVHPIRAELSSTSGMTRAVRISLLLCSIIYTARYNSD